MKYNEFLDSDLFHDLGGHPAGGPHEGVSDRVPGNVLTGGQPSTHPEIYTKHVNQINFSKNV